MKTEQWKSLKTINPNYQVSNQGRLRKQLADGSYQNLAGGFTQSKGNYHFMVIDGKKYYTHRLVMLAFVGECPLGHEVDHINRNTIDNSLENLRYLPISQNRKATAKLDISKVKAILYLTSVEGITQKKIAQLFDVHSSTIARITSGETWKDVSR